jgi:hypothetical protein
VPLFQRKYCWGPRHWTAVLEDVLGRGMWCIKSFGDVLGRGRPNDQPHKCRYITPTPFHRHHHHDRTTNHHTLSSITTHPPTDAFA